MEITVYLDEDPLGCGEFYAYVSSDGHILANFGGFKTAQAAHDAAERWIPLTARLTP